MEHYPGDGEVNIRADNDKQLKRQQAAAAERRKRVAREQERAHHSMSRVRMAYEIARWAMVFTAGSEPRRAAREVKRREVLQELRDNGRVARWLSRR